MGRGELHSATTGEQTMRGLNRNEVRRKMLEYHELAYMQKAGLERLQEIDREEAEARHQEATKEARNMHQEVMEETRKMHRQLHKLERWGFWVGVALGLVALLDFFGCSPKTKSEVSRPLSPETQTSPTPLVGSKIPASEARGGSDNTISSPLPPAEPAKAKVE